MRAENELTAAYGTPDIFIAIRHLSFLYLRDTKTDRFKYKSLIFLSYYITLVIDRYRLQIREILSI